jgi:hypothetical protein
MKDQLVKLNEGLQTEQMSREVLWDLLWIICTGVVIGWEEDKGN